MRERLETWQVEEYATVFERLPPVLVARLDGGLYLIDGLHRLAAAKQLGRESLAARLIDTDANGAYALAVRANGAHGLPLKTREQKAAARGLLVRFPERSDRWVAEDVGLDHKTVMGLRAGLESNGEIHHCSYTLAQDGRRFACDCARCRPGDARRLTCEDDPRK